MTTCSGGSFLQSQPRKNGSMLRSSRRSGTWIMNGYVILKLDHKPSRGSAPPKTSSPCAMFSYRRRASAPRDPPMVHGRWRAKNFPHGTLGAPRVLFVRRCAIPGGTGLLQQVHHHPLSRGTSLHLNPRARATTSHRTVFVKPQPAIGAYRVRRSGGGVEAEDADRTRVIIHNGISDLPLRRQTKPEDFARPLRLASPLRPASPRAHSTEEPGETGFQQCHERNDAPADPEPAVPRQFRHLSLGRTLARRSVAVQRSAPTGARQENEHVPFTGYCRRELIGLLLRWHTGSGSQAAHCAQRGRGATCLTVTARPRGTRAEQPASTPGKRTSRARAGSTHAT